MLIIVKMLNVMNMFNNFNDLYMYLYKLSCIVFCKGIGMVLLFE